MTTTTPKTSSENVTSSFCNNFAVNQSHYVCKMCSNYHGIKFEPALLRQQNKIEHYLFMLSRQLQNRSYHVVEERERLRNVEK